MRQNRVKRTLAAGGVAIGSMVFEFNTPGIGRIAAEAGADFLVFDMEHTGWSVETIRTLVATSRSAPVVPFVRVPAVQYHFIARCLDAGVMGVMVPMVESEQQARLIVDSVKYPPFGKRGAAFGVAHDDYTGGSIIEKMQSANTESLVICQIETAEGVKNADKIAAVDGVDVLWIGHFDLTNSLGIPGQFDHAKYKEAVDDVLAACARHGKAAGFMAASVDEGKALLKQGFRCLAFWGDLWIYREALRTGIGGIMREVARPATDSPHTAHRPHRSR
jgi:2-dehydro-3-deoxyglucarate aldolase/4-hydroxy-2-oxoheptanedioate aldolase